MFLLHEKAGYGEYLIEESWHNNDHCPNRRDGLWTIPRYRVINIRKDDLGVLERIPKEDDA